MVVIIRKFNCQIKLKTQYRKQNFGTKLVDEAEDTTKKNNRKCIYNSKTSWCALDRKLFVAHSEFSRHVDESV